MKAKLFERLSLFLAFLSPFLTCQSPAPSQAPKASLKGEKKEANGSSEFVTVEDGKFKQGDDEFRFMGTNNYYLHYKDKAMVSDAISSAASGGFNVMRMWGFFDGLDDDYTNNHAFMQPEANTYTAPKGMPSYYVNGWERMDYAVSEASANGVKLVIVFTNYWENFGGITQYVKWSDKANGVDVTAKTYSPDLSKFYTDDYCKNTYKAYMKYLVNRVNTVTKVAYKDDPTIMAFELMNEPRNPGKDPSIVTSWVDEMTTYFKTIDTNHLVGVGDEGFFANEEDEAYNSEAKDCYNGNQGVSYNDLIALDNVDFGTYHLYPESWGAPDVAQLWGEKWIKDHIASSEKANKPCLCEEFGINAQNGKNRELIYSAWCKIMYDSGSAGGMFWMLGGVDTSSSSDNGYYPDYDGFRLLWKGEEDSEPETVVLHNYATLFTYGKDFVTFEDKVFLMAPYKTDDAYDSEGPVVIDSDTTPVYQAQVSVRSDKKISRVALFTQSAYAGDMTYDSEGGYYYFDIEMKYYMRSFSITVFATVHFEDGTTLDSSQGYIERELKYSYNQSKKYGFSSTEGDSVVLEKYDFCAINSFTGVEASDFNGGSYKVTGASKPSTYWSEFKIQVDDLGSVLTDNKKFTYDVYFQKDLCVNYEGGIPAGAEATETSYGFRNYAALNPGWLKLCLNENKIKAADCKTTTIDDVEYYVQTVEITYSANASQTQLVLGIVFNYLGYDGSFYIDDLTFYAKKDEGTVTDGYVERPTLTEPGNETVTEEKTATNKGLVIGLSVGGGTVVLGGGLGLALFFIKRKHRLL